MCDPLARSDLAGMRRQCGGNAAVLSGAEPGVLGWVTGAPGRGGNAAMLVVAEAVGGTREPTAGAFATTGVTRGGRSATGAFCNSAGGTCTTAGATRSALAKTRCGTTVAALWLAKLALTTCGGGAPSCDSTIAVLMFLTLAMLMLRM